MSGARTEHPPTSAEARTVRLGVQLLQLVLCYPWTVRVAAMAAVLGEELREVEPELAEMLADVADRAVQVADELASGTLGEPPFPEDEVTS